MRVDEKNKISGEFCKILETVAFMFVEPLEKEDLPVFPADFIQAEVSFTGECDGRCSVAVLSEMCVEISANILGNDLNETLQQVAAVDAVKEIANITCGNVLTALYGDKPVFTITPPEVSLPEGNFWQEWVQDERVLFFSVDEWLVALKWEVFAKAGSEKGSSNND